LFVDLTVLPAYTETGFDGDAGTFAGPPFDAANDSTGVLRGRTGIDWSAHFYRGTSVAQAIASTQSYYGWPAVHRETVLVRHVVGRTVVGKLRATWNVTRNPAAGSTQFSAALGLPFCRIAVLALGFAVLQPEAENDSVAGPFLVAPPGGGSIDALTWNEQQVAAIPANIILDGYLPVARVTAVAHGPSIVGVVTDCAGERMPHVTVRAGGRSARTNAAGRYTLRVGRRGSYRVTVVAGASSASRSVRVR
ncbi:MAG TPA: carboxypeptidase-like regulatory domain-containing protein, partial [Gaiellaceae bacterium]|nr:carboxypeptidase-like regulatory domain-containing protein [Gaiellaceae bacterium]